jgi:hypothetical protein
VHAYDAVNNSSDRVLAMDDFMEELVEVVSRLDIALHEECVTGVWHSPVAGDADRRT